MFAVIVALDFGLAYWLLGLFRYGVLCVGLLVGFVWFVLPDFTVWVWVCAGGFEDLFVGVAVLYVWVLLDLGLIWVLIV